MFCPLVNGKQPIKSNFVMFWGVEPVRLHATIAAESPPRRVYYEGQHVQLELDVISWTRVEDGVYMIEAVDEPYYWKGKRVAIAKSDPFNGIYISELASVITEATGWNIEGLHDAKVSHLTFSGSVIAALDLLERLSGRLATLDHEGETIYLVDHIPEAGTFDSEDIVERGYKKPSVQDVVCYGTLLSPPMDNLAAMYELGIHDYGSLDLMAPAESWDIIAMSANESETLLYKWYDVTFLAVSNALRQHEVLIPLGRSLGIWVGFDADYGYMIDPITGEGGVGESHCELAEFHYVKRERYQWFDDFEDLQKAVNEFYEELVKGKSFRGIKVMVGPDTSSASGDYYTGFLVAVVGNVSFSVSKSENYSLLGESLVATYLRMHLLRHLKFHVDLIGLRTRFPYAVSASGEKASDVDRLDIAKSDVMYIHLGEVPTLETAQSYARVQLELLSKTGYVGVLNADPDGASKYVEDFSGGLYRAIAYFRE